MRALPAATGKFEGPEAAGEPGILWRMRRRVCFLKLLSFLLVDSGTADSWGLGGEPGSGGDKNQSKACDKAGKKPCLWHPGASGSPKRTLAIPTFRKAFSDATAG